MRIIDNIYTFKTKRFTVAINALEDYDIDLSFDDDGEVRRRLENGTLVCFCAQAVVYLDGVKIACDYLGECIYSDTSDFRDNVGLAIHSRKDGNNYGSYFSDMVHSVVADARKFVANIPKVRA